MDRLHFRHLLLQRRSDGYRCCGKTAHVQVVRKGNPVNGVCVFVEFIIAQFIFDEQDHEQTTSKGEGEAKNIYESESFISPEISECYFKIITEHVSVIYDLRITIYNLESKVSLFTIHQITPFSNSSPDLQWQP